MRPTKYFATTFLAAACVLAAAPATADKGASCHFHGAQPASRDTVVGCATQRKDALVAGGKIEASWKAVGLGTIEQVDGKKGKEWKVSFHNPKAADAAKQTLYVFLSLPGNVLAANFTGQ